MGRADRPRVGSLIELRGQLKGERDYWDRPSGDWGEGPPTSPAALERRELANSMFLLGSRALLRGELRHAESSLGQAAKEDHPGAWFRYAVLAHRLGPSVFGGDGAREWRGFLIACAAELGHGDAARMRPLLRDPGATPADFEEWEDPRFGPELLAALAAPPAAQVQGLRCSP